MAFSEKNERKGEVFWRQTHRQRGAGAYRVTVTRWLLETMTRGDLHER
jgi:hypothetical protein